MSPEARSTEPAHNAFSTVEEAIEAIRNGEMVIVADDEEGLGPGPEPADCIDIIA